MKSNNCVRCNGKPSLHSILKDATQAGSHSTGTLFSLSPIEALDPFPYLLAERFGTTIPPLAHIHSIFLAVARERESCPTSSSSYPRQPIPSVGEGRRTGLEAPQHRAGHDVAVTGTVTDPYLIPWEHMI